MRTRGNQVLSIADTSAQDIQLAPQDPRRRRLIAIGVALAVIAGVVFAAPSVKRWANASVSVPFERVRSVERERGWDEALWRTLCQQGWLGLPFSEEYGGGGGSLTILCLGDVIIGPAGRIKANGGHGSGGENTAGTNRIGGGSGGGGAVVSFAASSSSMAPPGETCQLVTPWL